MDVLDVAKLGKGLVQVLLLRLLMDARHEEYPPLHGWAKESIGRVGTCRVDSFGAFHASTESTDNTTTLGHTPASQCSAISHFCGPGPDVPAGKLSKVTVPSLSAMPPPDWKPRPCADGDVGN